MGHCCGCMATSTAGVIGGKKWRDPELDRIINLIREKGGNVNAEVLFTLVWDNHSDLDMHLFSPDQLNSQGLTDGDTGKIYYRSHVGINDAWNSGYLDLDANGNSYSLTYTPVENIAFTNVEEMPEGNYLLSVNQYNDRKEDGKPNTFTILIAFKNRGESEFTKVLVMKSNFSLDGSNGDHARNSSFYDLIGLNVRNVEGGKDVKITWVNSGGFTVDLVRDIAFAEGVMP